MNNESQMLKEEWKRLIRVEEQVAQIRVIARLAWSLVVSFIIGTGSVVYSYATLKQEVAAIDITAFKSDVSTALTVLGDHGTELQDIRNESARLRGNMDEMWKAQREFRNTMDDKTRERFYKSDGDRHDARITRLEEFMFQELSTK